MIVDEPRPVNIVWHNDALREHVANLCTTCHPADCYICARAALLTDASA